MGSQVGPNMELSGLVGLPGKESSEDPGLLRMNEPYSM